MLVILKIKTGHLLKHNAIRAIGGDRIVGLFGCKDAIDCEHAIRRRIENLHVEYCNCVNAIEFQCLGKIGYSKDMNKKREKRKNKNKFTFC